jgi:hypothetical protein
MAIETTYKKKSARGKKPGTQQFVAEWTIEPGSTPHHVNGSFVGPSETSDASENGTMLRFALPCGSAAELIEELKVALTGCAAMDSPNDEPSAHVTNEAANHCTTQNESNDIDPIPNYFALGAYGFAGN